MANEDFVLGDDDNGNPINPVAMAKKEDDKVVAEVMNSIKKAGEITDSDKKKMKEKDVKRAEVKLTEEQEIANLSSDLSDFIYEKISIDNEDGGVIERFPTGIDLLDAAAGGGFGVGTFTMICGSPGTFKSALLGQTIGAGQRKYNGKMLATYHDAETATTKERLANMGANRPMIEPYTDVTVENIFKTIETICAFKELRNIKDYPSIVGWDSIANTCTEKDKTTDDINTTIGLKARLLSQLFPRYLNKMKEYKISLIAVNQLREKLEMGMYAPAADLQHMGNKDVPGGQAVKYNAYHMLYLKNKGDLKFEQYGFNGVRVEGTFIKNKFFRPNIPVMMMVDFNTGISNFWTNYNFLVDQKKIQAGAWNFLLKKPEQKFRTKDALDLYNNNTEGFKVVFDAEVKETIDQEIIQKYAIKR